MSSRRAVIITSEPGALARLVAPISGAGFTVEAWSPPGSRLAYSRHVSRHTDLSTYADARVRQLVAIAGTLDESDWVILGTDEDVNEVSDLASAHPEVATLLPMRRLHGAAASKIAMAAALAELGVAQPRWAIAHSPEDLTHAVAQVGGHAMVKRPRGGSGRGVREVGRADPTWPFDPDPADRGDVLVQEWVAGATCSVDLVVAHGRVAIAPYSVMTRFASQHGVSVTREFSPMPDPSLRTALARMAEGFGGSWFANVTAIRRADGTHGIVEVDLRPNVWHAYLGPLGYPMQAALVGIRSGGPVPDRIEPTRRKVVNVTRAAKVALIDQPSAVGQVLTPAAWRYMHRGDLRLSCREARDFARWLVISLPAVRRRERS